MLHCIHAELTKVAAMNRPSMVAAFALALVTSSYTIRGRMRAARHKALVGAYCNISLAFSKDEQRLIRTLHLQRRIGWYIRLGLRCKTGSSRGVINPVNLRFQIVHILRRHRRVVLLLQQLQHLLRSPPVLECLSRLFHRLSWQLPQTRMMRRVP